MEFIVGLLIYFCLILCGCLTIYVMIQMADIHGWIVAILWFLLGSCFMQMPMYLWGWVYWKHPLKMKVMLLWTAGLIGISILYAIGYILQF